MPEPPVGAMPIPATPLSQLGHWHLEIRCSRCQRERNLPISALAARYGGGVMIIDVLRRLRCGARTPSGRCGGIPANVVIAETDASDPASHRPRELTVWNGPQDATA